MRRIREAAMCKRVGHKQIAKLIVNSRLGHGQKRKQVKAHSDNATKQSYRRKDSASAQFFEYSFNKTEEGFVRAWKKRRGKKKPNRDCDGEDHAAATSVRNIVQLWF